LEVVDAFERVTGIAIPREFAPRRSGDVASSYADVTLAKRELGWQAQFGIEDMCRDSWRWQSSNPQGYPDEGFPDLAFRLAHNQGAERISAQ
jgi:UDP-glucose 4-epimerase